MHCPDPKRSEPNNRLKHMKTLRLWNGRPHGVLPTTDWTETHVCIAAYSAADARRVCAEAGLGEPSASELKNYFSECWGNDMKGISPARGVWVTRRGHTPERKNPVTEQTTPAKVARDELHNNTSAKPVTDITLLQIAAKAAHLDVIFWSDKCAFKEHPHKPWNPLLDEGDRLGLLRVLKLSIDFDRQCVSKRMPDGMLIQRFWGGDHGDEAHAVLFVVAEMDLLLG